MRKLVLRAVASLVYMILFNLVVDMVVMAIFGLVRTYLPSKRRPPEFPFPRPELRGDV